MFKFLINSILFALVISTGSFSQAATSQSAVLDDFEGTPRSLGGHTLWANYSGEGAAATMSFATNSKKDGSNGLLYHMTGGLAYMHFYGNDGTNWLFAHQLLISGTWTKGAFNRMSFWVYHPSTLVPQSNNDHLIELGTYTRSENGDAATQNAGGTHYYHYYNPAPGVWTKVVVDNHPQHAVGGSTSDSGIITSPTSDGSGWNYFDSLTRFYWSAPYDAATSMPADIYFDDFTFYNEAGQDDVANIASVEASYNAATKKLHVGFVRNSRDDTTYTARYASSDINALGFANATLLGSVGADGLGDYVNKKIEGTVTLSGSVVYIAIQKQGQTGFRQIALPLSASTAVTPTPPTGVLAN